VTIPTVHCTGNDQIDHELGLMLKWLNNGSLPMALSHALRATMTLLELISRDYAGSYEAKKLFEFITRELWENPAEEQRVARQQRTHPGEMSP
jgi:hypothetical protein